MSGLSRRTIIIGSLALLLGLYSYGSISTILEMAPARLFDALFILFFFYLWDDFDILGIPKLGR